MTREEAVAKANSGWWKDGSLTASQVVRFQMYEDRLCMPWAEFHRLTQEVLGRPVFTHEFAHKERLIRELDGGVKPTLEQVLEGVDIVILAPEATE